MSESRRIEQLSDEIHSQLAAIRNALHLAEVHSDDPTVFRYLRICNEEVTSMMRNLRMELAENEARERRHEREIELVRQAAA